MADALNENSPNRKTATGAKAKQSTRGVALCVMAGIIAIVSGSALAGSTTKTSLYAENDSQQPKPKTLAWHERAAAYTEQKALVDLASVCPLDPAESGSKATVAVSAGDLRNIDLTSPAATASPQPGRLSGYLMAVAYLSQEIGRARVEAATAVGARDQWRQELNWAIVLIGALGTVLISLKSMVSKETKLTYMLSVAAIVASALSTSASSLNAFYTPNIAYEKSQRLLTSLQHLHSKLVIGMTRQAAVVRDGSSVICAPIEAKSWDKDWRLQWLRNLSDQFQNIQVSADDVGNPGAEGPATDLQSLVDPQSPVDPRPTNHPDSLTRDARVTQK